MKYRKKPIIIEAMEFTEGTKDEVFDWINCMKERHHNYKGEPYIKIKTLKNNTILNLGDYVIKGINGKFYPVKKEIFNEIYEKVEDVKNE